MREMRTISFVTKMIDDGWIKDEYRKKMKRCYLHAIRADLTMPERARGNETNFVVS
jgi:NTE family protein